ncbi:hypothetical protein GQ457_07G013440 [Hibiscus cannabinus]
MTVVEVTVLHVVAEAEEVALSSSSEVVDNIIAEKDMENKKENLSNDVKEGTDGDGSYIGVNGNDAVHGVPVELNREKNGNCVGEEDGEVKSESDSVGDESCMGTGDQEEEEEEPIELCQVESAVDEQQPMDAVEDDPASAVLETSMAAHDVVSESPEDAVIDFSVEISAVSDCNGDGLVEESFEAEFEDEETAMMKDSIDSSQNSLQVVKPSDIVEFGPSVEGGESSGIVETGSSIVLNENVTVETVSTGSDAGAFVLDFGSFPLMLNNVSVNGIMTETLLPSPDDPKIETETVKSDENNERVSSLISERDISSGSIVSEEVEDGGECDGSSAASSEQNGGIRLGNSVGDDVERKMPFNYLIKVPRYNDENLKEKIRLAQISVDERTRSRDAIRIEMQSMRATCKEYGNAFNAAVSQEREARVLLGSKRQEIESLQSVIDIEDIDVKIRNLERTIQHEPLTLKVEKNLIRDIKQLKQTREKLSSTMSRQDEMRQANGVTDLCFCCIKLLVPLLIVYLIGLHLQSLKKESDQLKANVLKAEVVTKAAKRKYYDESEKLNNLQSRFNAANGIRQEAYAQLQSLKKQSYEKSKHFWQYKDDLNTAKYLALKGDKEALHSFCTNQVEKFMDLWNNNDEFRNEYMRCNARSTIWRLGTLDGRALGPNEVPPVIPRVVNERVANDHTVSGLTVEDQEKVVLAKAEEEAARKAEELRKEEEEAARKAEEVRKEEEAAKLREQLRLEEIAKAKEALERKRRKAEKAQAWDAERTLKEAEKKEKKREKRERKKERRKAAMAADDASNASITDEAAFTPTAETLVETPKQSENKEEPTSVQQMPQNPKQTKAKSIPPSLRNKGRRRMQPWMWPNKIQFMVKGGQNLPADVIQVIDQLERHCLSPDGSLLSKSSYYDLQLAREEMSRERLRYLEAMAIYCEAIGMVEEYQQAVSVVNLGGIRDLQGLYPQGLKNSPQVYETLEHRLAVAEAAQRLRLPLISKDGEIQEEEIEKWSIMSRSSLDSTSTSLTISSSSNSLNYANSAATAGAAANNTGDSGEPGVGGVPNRFLGITPAYLWQTQLQHMPLSMDMADYQLALSREIDARLKSKCDKLAEAFVDDIDSSSGSQSSSSRLPERVKLIIEEIEREEAALREDLYSADRKFAEYYNVLEQILGVLIKLVKDLKLQHQHKYDELQKTWLCKRCETMNAKLRVLEHVLLLETYTQESIPALHKIRKYLVEATEEASAAYNKAVTRLREYQGVDPYFDTIARQYHDVVKKLENMQWTIHQVEMDLKRLPDHAST